MSKEVGAGGRFGIFLDSGITSNLQVCFVNLLLQLWPEIETIQ